MNLARVTGNPALKRMMQSIEGILVRPLAKHLTITTQLDKLNTLRILSLKCDVKCIIRVGIHCPISSDTRSIASCLIMNEPH